MPLTKRLLKGHTILAISLLAGLLASSASIYFDIVDRFYLATRRLATWHLDELLLILIIIGGAVLVASVKHYLKNWRIGSGRHFRLVTQLHEAMAWRRQSTSQFAEELTRTKLRQMADGPTAVFIVDGGSSPAVRDVELQAAAEQLEAIMGDGRVSYFQVYGKRTSSSASNWRRRTPFLIHPALAPDSQIWIKGSDTR